MCDLNNVGLSPRLNPVYKYCKVYLSKEKLYVIPAAFIIPKSSPIKVSMFLFFIFIPIP